MQNQQSNNQNSTAVQTEYELQVRDRKVSASALSNIIQTSNECSSNNNEQQRGKKFMQIESIIEQKSQSASPVMLSFKTYNFESDVHTESLQRRTQTLDENYLQEFGDANSNNTEDMQVQAENLDSQLQNQEIEQNFNINNRPFAQANRKKRSLPKIMLIFVLFLSMIQFVNIITKGNSVNPPEEQMAKTKRVWSRLQTKKKKWKK